MLSIRNKVFRPPMRLNWLQIRSSVGEERYLRRVQDLNNLERLERENALYVRSKSNLKDVFPKGVYYRVWGETVQFHKTMMMRAVWEHLVPLHCKYKTFTQNVVLVRECLQKGLYGGIVLNDFYLDETSAVQAVKSVTNHKYCHLFSIVKEREKDLMDYMRSTNRKEKKFIKMLFDVYGEEKAVENIHKLRFDFYDPANDSLKTSEWIEYFGDNELAEDVTSISMFKHQHGKKHHLDSLLTNANMNFEKACVYMKSELVLTVRFLQVARGFFRETMDVYITLEEWKANNPLNVGNMKVKENEKLGVLCERYGVKRRKKDGVFVNLY